jgi:type I restriction-modification system DNA methylase subunit
MNINNIIQNRKERRKSTGEDFTPTPLVNEILDRLTIDSNGSVWEEEKTFIDPACGDGQFLVEVLKRKLDKGHNQLKALSTIYGCDIMFDNIEICKDRLLKLINNKKEAEKILNKNIVCTPLDKYPKGSLDYLSLDEGLTF